MGRKGKESEGKKICIFVREGNGKDKMSFPSVGRKWEGNIDFFLEWEGNGKELMFIFREKWEKEGKNWEKCPKFCKNWPKIVKIQNFEQFCIFLNFF